MSRRRRGGRFVRLEGHPGEQSVPISRMEEMQANEAFEKYRCYTWFRVADGFELPALSGWAVMRGGSVRKQNFRLREPIRIGILTYEYVTLPMIFDSRKLAEEHKQPGDYVKQIGLVELT